MLFLSIALVLTLIGLLTYYVLLLRQRYEYFSRRDIVTPPFHFYFGHLKTLWSVTSYHRQLENWTKQYGKIYGIFEGTTPTFVVSDPNFIQEVFVKQFSIFHARKPSLGDSINSNIFFSSGSKWRRYRHVINPTFTTAKLKLMSPLINGCIDDLMGKLINHVGNDREFNIYLYYKRMTMDAICRCAFGIDTDLQNNPNNIYLKKVEAIFAENALTENVFFRYAQLMPEIGNIIARIFSIDTNVRMFLNKNVLPLVTKKELYVMPFVWLLSQLHKLVERQQQTPTARVDFLQLMLQVVTDQAIDDDKAQDSRGNYRLTVEEIIGNILIFMMAGYETTSTALACATYELARHPSILEKLQAEIDQFATDTRNHDDETAFNYIDYDILAQMPYMNHFVSEVLRMYPIANTAIQRYAAEDTVVQGIKIDKGSIVHADVFSVHYDRELWGPDDPYVFLPERHETKRHPMALLAFGAGPRQCIGTRFALIEMKTFLIRLLRDYTVLPGEHLESNFNIRERLVIGPEEVWIKLMKRSN